MVPFEITVEELKKLMDEKAPLQLIDCREPNEYALSNIGGTLIPIREISQNLDDFDPEVPIVVMCHVGGRSTMVTEFLRRNGYPAAQNLRGGIDEWSEKID